jgi:iron complex outermembrane recepter protein
LVGLVDRNCFQTERRLEIGRDKMKIALLLSVSMAAMGWSGTALAQEGSAPAAADESNAAEIVVTAQKRSERAQDVPISISAFGGSTLAQANVTQISDLTRLVPTLNFATTPGSVGARYSIRGLGAFANSAIEPSVATFLDGVYIPRAGSLNAGLLDVQSVEVLSGPQGTLFGRNASVGAISITTALPVDHIEGSVAVEGGTGERYRGEVVVNLPVSDRVALRFAGLGEKFGGYWHYTPTGRRFGGVDTISLRLTGRAELSDNLSLVLRGDYQSQTGDGYNNVSLVPGSITPTILTNFSSRLGGRLPIIGITSNSSLNDPSTANIDDYHWGVSSTLSFETESNFSFKLINSYRHSRALEQDGEVTYTPVSLFNRKYLFDSRSHNHELQIVSPTDQLLEGRLSFVAGLYYFREKLDIDYDFNLGTEWCSTVIAAIAPPALPACNAGQKTPGFFNRFPQTTESYAGYGQASLEILPTVSLTLGGRYTHESKDATYTAVRVNPAAVFGTNESTTLDYSDNRFTSRVNLSWKPSRDLMFFATYSTGFKAGGFNSGASNVVLGATQRGFGPETVKNYELGAKTQFFNRRLTIDATAYRMDVSGFQERALINAISIVNNVGNIRSQGVEANVTARPVPWLQLHGSLAYLDAKFTSYPNAPALPWLSGVQDLTGKRPTFAPKWTTSFGIESQSELGGGYRATIRADVSARSRQNVNAIIDASPTTVQDGYALLSARLTVFSPDDRWSLAVFGQNLTDKHYCSTEGYQVLGPQLGALDPGRSIATICFHGNPRTFGARLGAKF